MLLATGAALASCAAAYDLSVQYYRSASYHYDSASYRQQAIHFHDRVRSVGRLTTAAEAARAKDSLDVVLRVILAPHLLVLRHGHLAVLLPFLIAFLALLFWFVFNATGSWLIAGSAASSLFVFPFMYEPLGGIADYWKDSLGVWLFGSAVVSWILSRASHRLRWIAVSGLFLGLLAWQRTATAAFAIVLFLPLVLGAALAAARRDGVRRAARDVAAFALPVGGLTLFLALLQRKVLYAYYFGLGYAYPSPRQAFHALSNEFPGRFGWGVAWAVLLVVLFLAINMHQTRPGLAVAVYFAIGYPVIVIGSSTFYFGAIGTWSVLLVILVAASAAAVSEPSRRLKALAASSLVLSAALVYRQYDRALPVALERAKGAGYFEWRESFREIGAWLRSRNLPRHYGLFFDEVYVLLFNQMYFDDGIYLRVSPAFMSVHDSYYRFIFGNASPEAIVERNLGKLETVEGALAVGQLVPEDVLQRRDFTQGQNPLAARVAFEMNKRLAGSGHWKAVRWIRSPWGPLSFYVCSLRSLDAVEKWGGMKSSAPLAGILVALDLAPAVRQYDYRSRIPPEEVDGVAVQPLPVAPDSVVLTLFSDAARRVVFRGHVSHTAAGASILVGNGSTETAVPAENEQEVAVALDLVPGLNRIRVGVRVETAAPGPEVRVIVLSAPRLTRISVGRM